MNIVYIHTHDLGNWIPPLGRDVEAPNITALAAESTLFTNAQSAAPTCSPSRAALLTGVNPHQAQMLGLAHRGFSLTHPERHVASLLRNRGYETVLCGIQHVFSSFDVEGFPYDHVLAQIHRTETEPMESYQRRRDAEVADAASDWLRNRSGEGNFFLSVGFFQPHRPLLEADPDIKDSAVETPAILPGEDRVRGDFQSLKTSIRYLDRAVGRVVEALKESGEWDRSIILFTTDHGIAFPLHKCCLRDSGTRVVLMLRHPGLPATHGTRTDALVSHQDVLPTFLEWLGLPLPDWCEGHSLDKLMKGEVAQVREEVFAEVNYHAAYEPMRSIRTREYRLVRHFLNDGGWVLSNIDDSPAKEAWMESPSYREGVPEWELYDLRKDPEEAVNLADDPEYAEVRSQLEARLLDWMRRTDDPLLRGPLPRPADGVVNHRDSTSPHERFYEDILK
ncbi:MAG: sulfatase family protein [Oceanipulchritudo sp.]